MYTTTTTTTTTTNARRSAQRGVVWKRTGGVLTGLLLATGVTGTAQAQPDGPQLLRGLEGRVFLVDVAPAGSPESTLFENCYTFDAEGGWTDPLVPVDFTFDQTRIGASTDYLVRWPDGSVFQAGSIRPGPRGVLQLVASTTVPGLGSFVSTGHEVESCP